MLTAATLCLLWAPGIATAASTPPREHGLLITPLRQFLSIKAGHALDSSFTVANLTDRPLTITLSVQQFSVTNYVYNYRFEAPTNNWLHLGLTTVSLAANQTANIPYHFQVPVGTSPGGRYYTLFASANVASQGAKATIQAADLVYLTVAGKLVRTSHLQHSSIGWLAFGRSIPFNVQPVNTGNVYFFAYVSGRLHGLWIKPAPTPDTHLLMPGTVRTLSGSIASPVLPGVYRATYGYRTDAGQSVMKTSYVLFIPPWFVAFLLAALLLAGKLLPRQRPTKKETTKP